MLEIALMIEGQMGLNWPRWKSIAKEAEDLGFAGLYRSDHFTNPSPPDRDSLELWTSLTWLASHSKRLEFGPLVSPFTFRHPSMVARVAASIDELSGGRLQLGLGAGWQKREHRNYGFQLGSIDERFRRFEEGLEIVSLLFGSQDPIEYQGSFYELHDAILRPNSRNGMGPTIVIGGNGLQRTLPLAVKYASEWNGVYLSPTEFRKRNKHIDALLETDGRKAKEIKRSLMLGCVFGQSSREADRKAQKRAGKNAAALRKEGVAAGNSREIADLLHLYADAGCQRVMLQWLDLDDLEALEAMAKELLPQFS